jgi:hypothetical protein
MGVLADRQFGDERDVSRMRLWLFDLPQSI